MFGNYADPIFSLVKSTTSRKEKAALWLRYYNDQQADETLKLISRRWSRPQDFRIFSLNLVKKIINKRANLYRLPPRRIFGGMDQTAGEAIYRQLNADVVLKRSSRLTKLLKTTLLQVGWSTSGPTLSIVTPNIVDAVATDPERPERVIVTQNGTTANDVIYHDWSHGGYRRLDFKGRAIPLTNNPGGANPYGALPFVAIHDRYPDDQFFLPGGDDLVEAQDAVNVALVNLWRAVELQAHGQAWAAGIAAGDALSIGPDRAVTLPEGGKFGFAAPNAPISDILQAIEFVMRQVAATNDLSADVFDLDRSSESGAAKHVEQIDLKEARLDDIALWRTYEARLWEVTKIVINTHQPGTIPADATLAVDFAELQDNLTEGERLVNARTKYDMGVWSAVDVLRAENPDGYSTREEAFAELQRRKTESDALRPESQLNGSINK